MGFAFAFVVLVCFAPLVVLFVIHVFGITNKPILSGKMDPKKDSEEPLSSIEFVGNYREAPSKIAKQMEAHSPDVIWRFIQYTGEYEWNKLTVAIHKNGKQFFSEHPQYSTSWYSSNGKIVDSKEGDAMAESYKAALVFHKFTQVKKILPLEEKV